MIANAAQAFSLQLERTLELAGAFLLALLLVTITFSVLLRYVAESGFTGAEEAASWLLVALVSIGLPLASTARGLRIDLFEGGPASGHGHDHAQVSRRSSQFVGGGNTEPWLWPRRIALRDLRALFSGTITLLACIILMFGSGRAALDLGGVSPSLGLSEGLRPAVLSAGGVLAIVAILLHHLAERRFLAFVSMLVVAAGAHWAVGAAPILSLTSPSVILCCLALAAIFAGTPLPHAFIAAASVAVAFGAPMPEEAMAAATLSGMSRYLLTAIPFFLLAGALLTASGIASDLVRFAAALVGHRRAGLGQTVLLTGVLFSGASGSSIANAAFGTAAFMPQLTKRGTPPERAGALIAAVSVLDNIIPPSIALLILAAAADLSTGKLLAGGFVAGLVMAATLAVAIHFNGATTASADRVSAGECRRLGVRALPAFGLGIIVVAGIRAGVVAPTEAAALAAAYTLVAAILKRTAIQEIGVTFRQSARETAAILLLIGSATPFAFLIAVDGVAAQVSSAAAWLGSNPFLVIAALNLLLLGVGLFLDIGAAILLFAPLTLPVAVSAGIDSIHFGVILVVNLMIGGLTPPVGILVQTVGNASGVPVVALFAASRPYLLALLSALALLSFSAALAACF
ncbi:TRAP transporter large permease [Ensifer sp. ENS11]|uniref:TRAP transporter large permease n=1 Tax=Ensifer sp. ENS11 TaxID=2769291 RepID=UPI00177FC6D1|nr:TRAP transporter large permease [Ensifer sp. ENS11]MBD9491648.1 TRAP transporter large permease [Ensifer sp. ENS11]